MPPYYPGRAAPSTRAGQEFTLNVLRCVLRNELASQRATVRLALWRRGPVLDPLSALEVDVGMLDAVWAQLAGTVFLGFVGLWLAHNYRRQVRLKLAERQVDAYTDLWKLTAFATPYHPSPLEPAERQKLYEDMGRWYFSDGNGIFVSVRTRDLFIAFRKNLVCPVSEVTPAVLARQLAALPEADAERRRGCVSKRHATLLRGQLKNDLVLHIGFGSHYDNLRRDDRAFLRSCGLNPWRRPWRRRHFLFRRGTRPAPCVCGMCEP
jgi:hypothetical protein